MKTAINKLIDELQLHLNGLGVMQYNKMTKTEQARDLGRMEGLRLAIEEAKKLLETEKNQIIEANNYKYVNLNLKAETYFENKYLCKDNQ